jgi:hypothetical protein
MSPLCVTHKHRARRTRAALAALLAFVALVALVALAVAAPVQAQVINTRPLAPKKDSLQRTAHFGTIEGIVTDTNLVPLGGAEISILRTTFKLATQSSGRFRVNAVPQGQYLLIVKRIGYRPATTVVDVPESDTVRLSYTLERALVAELDTVRITAKSLSKRMEEFEARRKFGIGEFMGPEEIDKRNSVFATELIRKFSTINVQMVQSSKGPQSKYYPVSRRATGSLNAMPSAPGEEPIPAGVCVLSVFVDNIPMPTPFDLDLLPSPRDLQAIEVYSGSATIPPQFNGLNRGCGVMLVWTKDR